MTDLTREQKLELYRYMRLNRVVEERLVNLYRQGKVVGGLYRSLGQEATSVGSRLRAPEGRHRRAAHPQPGRRPRHGLLRARRHDAVHGARRPRPRAARTATCTSAIPDRGVISPISMLGALIPVMAGIALAGRMQKKDLVAHDLDRRRRHVHRRLPRGAELRRRAEAAARRRRREQRLGLLDAVREADRLEEPRRQGARLRHPGRAGGRQRRARRPRRGAAGRGPRARRRGARRSSRR